MLTAAAPALPDSPALPPAAAGTGSNSSSSSASFQSVYQSLPVHSGDSQATSNSALPNSKEPSTKRNSSKGADDHLPASVSPTPTVDSSSPRPWVPALPSFSLTAQPRTKEPEPASRETAQLSLPEQEASLRDAASNLIQPPVAAARQLAASREPGPSLQGPTSTPSFLLGGPSLPVTPQPTQLSSLPESRQPANSSRPPETASVDPGLFTKGLAAALAPKTENLAFSIKMQESNSVARHTQQAMQPDPMDRNQAAPQSKVEERTAEPSLASSAIHATTSPATIPSEVAAATASVSPVWNDAAAAPQVDLRTDTQFSEPHQPVNISTVAALHDAQPVLPEAPRQPAAGKILLQLGGKDQTAAAIRVTDRAGTVNVSVHANDADLRSSLRSNLNDLASQLSHQGWKTEMVKTATTLTRGESSQDTRQDGQRSPGHQQPSSQGERQPQRDRRTASGQWRAEFEEQASSTKSGNPGGTN